MSSRPWLTPEQHDRIVELYQSGFTLHQVGAVVGCTGEACALALERRGVPRRSCARLKLTPEQGAIVEGLHASGVGLNDIAARVRSSEDACRRWLVNAGIVTRGKSRKQKYTINDDYFKVIDRDDKAYFLGLLTADGCVSTRGEVILSLEQKDEAVVAAFRDAVAPDMPLRHRTTTNKFSGGKPFTLNTVGLAVYSIPMAAHLAAHGVLPRKSLAATAWEGPPELLAAYFRGLIDGDGHWHYQPSPIRHHVGLIGTESVTSAFLAWAERRTGAPPTKAYRTKCGLLTVRVNRRAALMAIVAELYSTATVWMPRKRATAEAIAALPDVPPKVSAGFTSSHW